MNLKPFALAAGLTLMANAALAQDYTETRALDPFTKVRADGMLDVVIEVGGAQKVTVKASREKHLKGTSTRVHNGTLIVDTEENNSFFNLFGSYNVTVYIIMPALEEASQDGMGDLTIRGVNSDTLTLSLNGMGDLDVSGACGHGDFSHDGMGDLNARNLKCKTVKVQLDGMGDAEIFATEFADVNADGMGDVNVYGNPKDTNIRKDGMGSVNTED